MAETEPGVSHYAASYYLGEHPADIRTLADLPSPLRDQVENHLRSRLGDKFYAHLKFRGGHHRDQSKPHEAPVPGTVFYELNFSFSRPNDGIAEYVALLALAEDGSVLNEIDLPSFHGGEDAHRFVSLRQATELAGGSGFSGPGIEIELDYSRELDCLRWRFRHLVDPASAQSESRSAHSPGEIQYRSLHVLMLDHPVVEIHDEYAIR